LDSFKILSLNGIYSCLISSILTGSSFLITLVGIFGTASNAMNWLFRTSSNNLGSSFVEGTAGSFLWIFLSVSYLLKTSNASFAALNADCQGAKPCKFRPLSTLLCCCSALSASWPSLWMKA